MTELNKGTDKKTIRITLTKPYLETIDKLIEKDIYSRRSEIIKEALRRFFAYHGLDLYGKPATKE